MDSLDKFSWGGSGMVRECAEWICENVKEGATVLEVGAGEVSTKFFSERYKVYSIEQASEWVGTYDNVNYIHAPLNDGWYSLEHLQNLPQDYDLLLIDGPVGGNRRKILDHIDLFNIKNNFIIVEDTYRPLEREIVNSLVANGKEIILEGKEGDNLQFTVLK